MRSPTAADVVAAWDGFTTDFAGLSNDADEKLSLDHIEWADTIIVMEQRQKKRLTALFGIALGQKRVVVLGVPDKFDYMQPELVTLLDQKLRNVL